MHPPWCFKMQHLPGKKNHATNTIRRHPSPLSTFNRFLFGSSSFPNFIDPALMAPVRYKTWELSSFPLSLIAQEDCCRCIPEPSFDANWPRNCVVLKRLCCSFIFSLVSLTAHSWSISANIKNEAVYSLHVKRYPEYQSKLCCLQRKRPLFKLKHYYYHFLFLPTDSWHNILLLKLINAKWKSDLGGFLIGYVSDRPFAVSGRVITHTINQSDMTNHVQKRKELQVNID